MVPVIMAKNKNILKMPFSLFFFAGQSKQQMPSHDVALTRRMSGEFTKDHHGLRCDRLSVRFWDNFSRRDSVRLNSVQ